IKEILSFSPIPHNANPNNVLLKALSMHQTSPSREPQKTFLPFGNPFRTILLKGSLSSKHLDLLNTFEDTLTTKLRALKPAKPEQVLCLSWMKNATRSLCETHADIKILITALELPVQNWDEKWIDIYLINSTKLLDTCLAFTSEISRLRRAHLYLTCAVHDLKISSPKKLIEARSFLDEWSQCIRAKNPRLDGCFSIMEGLAKTLDDVPKIKNSSKGKILMRAMFGVKVLTLFVCGTFFAAFTGSGKKLIDLRVPESCSWAEAFADLQNFVNAEIRKEYSRGVFTVLREVEEVYSLINTLLYPIVKDGVGKTVEAEMVLTKIVLDLQELDEKLYSGLNEKLYSGLNELAKEVDGFFKVILSGRDALLCNLRFVGEVSVEVASMGDVRGQAVR
ncbi:hypothetical protein STAS_02099, partial [Striga asiatica]